MPPNGISRAELPNGRVRWSFILSRKEKELWPRHRLRMWELGLHLCWRAWTDRPPPPNDAQYFRDLVSQMEEDQIAMLNDLSREAPRFVDPKLAAKERAEQPCPGGPKDTDLHLWRDGAPCLYCGAPDPNAL